VSEINAQMGWASDVFPAEVWRHGWRAAVPPPTV